MKSYIGAKIINAEPLDREGAPGYHVRYEDGYDSWSPKDVFESAYTIISDDAKEMIRPSVGLLDVARACHEINRAYCHAIGDDSQPAWEDAPDWQQRSAVEGVVFHIGNPDAGPQASHINWMKQKINDGWVYGEVKNEQAKTHPCMLPFEKLAVEQQVKDHLFRAVVNLMKE